MEDIVLKIYIFQDVKKKDGEKAHNLVINTLPLKNYIDSKM